MKSLKKYKLIIYYFIFGCLWVLLSDKLFLFLSRDVEQYSILYPYKEFLFIILTSITMLQAIKKSTSEKEALNRKLMNSNAEKNHNAVRCFEKRSQLSKLNLTVDSLFDLALRTLASSRECHDLFIIDLFQIASNLSPESNLGSAFVIEEGRVIFIDSIGFDLKELNSMSKDPSHYIFSSESIILNKSCKKEVERKLKNSNSQLKDIKESLYVGIYSKGGAVEGFNLDISMGSAHSFSDDTINKIQIIQSLANGFDRLKKESDYKELLQDDIVKTFITALEYHDEYTKGHSEEVALYSMELGLALNLDEKHLTDLYWSATMHDIGKIIIPDHILNKKERLSTSEVEIIKKNSVTGSKIVSQSETLKGISRYILHHHERWDGMGYPEGLKGDEIPLISQIISVADSWHAMTSERPYKKKLSYDEGIEELMKNRGTQFSPEVVDVFMKNKKLFFRLEYHT